MVIKKNRNSYFEWSKEADSTCKKNCPAYFVDDQKKKSIRGNYLQSMKIYGYFILSVTLHLLTNWVLWWCSKNKKIPADACWTLFSMEQYINVPSFFHRILIGIVVFTFLHSTSLIANVPYEIMSVWSSHKIKNNYVTEVI